MMVKNRMGPILETMAQIRDLTRYSGGSRGSKLMFFLLKQTARHESQRT